jgi:hypothetical protein
LKKALILFSTYILLAGGLLAQIGGRQNLDFINASQFAKNTALGGENVSLRSGDNNHFWRNPASLDTNVHNVASFNYNPYYAGIANLSASYTNHHAPTGIWAVGINYWGYGEMDRKDPSGNDLGGFNANDYVINVGYARRFGVFSYGSNLKFAHSNIAGFGASALLIDFGGQFIHPRHDLVFGMVFKNIGVALSNYNSETNLVMPFDVQLGASFKPQHMPLRFSTTIHRLYQYDIAYNDPARNTNVSSDGIETIEETSAFDKVMRHFVFGTEFIMLDGFNLRFGYNFLRRAEMNIEERKGLVGFSFGFMVRVKSLELAFSRSIDHISGGTNSFSLIMDINKLRKI